MTVNISLFEALLILFIMFALIILGTVIGHFACNDGWRTELVEKGHAEYYLNKDNRRQWRLIEIKKEIE